MKSPPAQRGRPAARRAQFRSVFRQHDRLSRLWALLFTVSLIASSAVFTFTYTDRSPTGSIVYSEKVVQEGAAVKVTPAPPLDDSSLWRAPEASPCGRLFGNGFSDAVLDCGNKLRCVQNPTSQATICTAAQLSIDRDRITVSPGGEPIEAVVGRVEGDEFPRYDLGALALDESCPIPNDPARFPHHLNDMLLAIGQRNDGAASAARRCLPGMTLFVTRYEYANLYHTITDWYNMYQASRYASGVVDLPIRHIILFDGHSVGALDDAMSKVFGVVPTYVSTLHVPTCVEHAVFVPAGYTSALSVGTMPMGKSCRNVPQVRDFVRFVLKGLRLDDADPLARSATETIVVILRKDYMAHPRVGQRPTSRKIANEDALLDGLADSFPEVDVRAVSFESMTMEEQVLAVTSASVVIGMHGAGLSHILFARSGAHLIELMPASHASNIHFQMFAQFAGVSYHQVPAGQQHGGDSYQVPVPHIVRVVHTIMNSRNIK